MAVILVSLCLLGIPCRYKGDSRSCERVLALKEKHTLIPVCPEQLGGLPTPRNPSERQGERWISCTGEDVTEPFRKGAEASLALAELFHCDFAILKAYSPSCGKGMINDGTFTGTRGPGSGAAAELLLKHGIPVYTDEEDWPV